VQLPPPRRGAAAASPPLLLLLLVCVGKVAVSNELVLIN